MCSLRNVQNSVALELTPRVARLSFERVLNRLRVHLMNKTILANEAFSLLCPLSKIRVVCRELNLTSHAHFVFWVFDFTKI